VNKVMFSEKIKLSREWIEHDMYPDDVFEAQCQIFLTEKGSLEVEMRDPEHYRNGLYWYWFKQLHRCDLLLLRKLLLLETDKPMLKYLLKELEALIRKMP